MIFLKNMTIWQKVNDRCLVKDFNFILNKNNKVAIIGEEGNGKSTLLKLIYDERLILDYCEYRGSFDKGNYKLGYLEQMLDEKWLDYQVIDYILADDFIDFQMMGEFKKLLQQFKLKSKIDQQLMRSLSGGEIVKIQLIKLLLANPDILLLDEPTNDLDIETLEWLENFIVEIEKPVIFISHDETLLEKTANVIVHLEQIKKKNECRHIVEKIDYQSYIDQRIKMIEKTTQIAKKQREVQKKKKRKLQQIYEKVEHQQETISRKDPHGAKLLKKKIKSLKAQEKRFAKEESEFLDFYETEEAIKLWFAQQPIKSNRLILKLEQANFLVHNKEIQKIKLEVNSFEKIVIIGENGVGKTTLLKYCYEKIKENSYIKVGYMPQNYTELMDKEEIAFKFLTKSLDNKEITKVRTLMGCLKFTSDEMEAKISELSGGQKAKLYLLKLVINEYDVILLDEPTRNLSPLSNPIIREVLKNYKGAIISVSHDRKYIADVVEKVYKLTNQGLEIINL